MASQQKNVGILAMEIYFPPTCVQQEALEAHDGVSKGKYTIGLGQDCLAFCTEVEDVISMSLTAVTSLLEKYGIDPKQIGRLEVGSETVIDKSKSIKTFLMQIFEETGNTDIEGVDSTNACYGGTAALLNCVNWVESSSWDGRYGLVVCTDSAVYAEGPARPTGGAAAIAMLIGPDAPIAFESKIRGSHMSHVYDFYKPNLASEYPVVDGKLSQTCYLMAVDSCYNRLCNKYEKFEGKQFSVDDADYFVFHSPYNKLVQKSFARLLFNDFLRNASSINEAAKEKLAPFSTLTGDESYQSRDLEKATQQVAKALYDAKVQPTTLVPKQVGNMYTASLYAAFASLIHKKHSSLVGQRIVMFSYGSGLTATMFSFRVRECQHPFSLSNIAAVMNVDKRDWECHFAATTSSDTDSYSFHTTDYNAKECSFKNETFYLSPLVNGGVDENTLDSERDGGDGCNISKLEDLEVRMDLTDDLLHMVFSFLKHIDLCQATMVCKQWQAASAHEDFWRVLYFENRNISVQQCGCFQHGIDSDTLIPSSHIKITRR